MSSSSPLPPLFVFKLHLPSEVLRFSLPSSSAPSQLFADFNAKLRQSTSFALSSSSSPSPPSKPTSKLTWKDDEGDVITVRTQDDFQELVKFMAESNQPTMNLVLEISEPPRLPVASCASAFASLSAPASPHPLPLPLATKCESSAGMKGKGRCQQQQQLTHAPTAAAATKAALQQKEQQRLQNAGQKEQQPKPAQVISSSNAPTEIVFPVLPGRKLEEDEEELFDEDEDITEAYDHEELHADLDQLETEVEALQSHSLIPLKVQRRLERIDQKWGLKQEKWNRAIQRIRGRPNFDEDTYQQRLKILSEHEAIPNSPFLQLLVAKKVLKDSKRKPGGGAEKGIECPQLSTRMHLFSERTQQFLIIFARHGLPSGWVVANYLEKQGLSADLEQQSPGVNEPPSYQSALLQMQLEELRGLTQLPMGLKLKVLKKLNSKRTGSSPRG